MRYYLLEQLDQTIVGIKKFADYTALSEYINCDYAEDRDYPKEDLILREDGAVCRIDTATTQNEVVDFIETNETVELSKFNAAVASFCKYSGLPSNQHQIVAVAQLPGVLNGLLEHQRKGVRRFVWLVWLVIAAVLTLLIGWKTFR